MAFSNRSPSFINGTIFTVGFMVFPPRDQRPTVIYQRRPKLPQHLLPLSPGYARNGMRYVGPSSARAAPQKGCLKKDNVEKEKMEYVVPGPTYVMRQVLAPSKERWEPRKGCLKKNNGKGKERAKCGVLFADELPRGEEMSLVTRHTVWHEDDEGYDVFWNQRLDEGVAMERGLGEEERMRVQMTKLRRRRKLRFIRSVKRAVRKMRRATRGGELGRVKRERIRRECGKRGRRLRELSVRVDGVWVSRTLGDATNQREVNAEPAKRLEDPLKVDDTFTPPFCARETAYMARLSARAIRIEVNAAAKRRRAIREEKRPERKVENEELELELEQHQQERRDIERREHEAWDVAMAMEMDVTEMKREKEESIDGYLMDVEREPIMREDEQGYLKHSWHTYAISDISAGDLQMPPPSEMRFTVWEAFVVLHGRVPSILEVALEDEDNEETHEQKRLREEKRLMAAKKARDEERRGWTEEQKEAEKKWFDETFPEPDEDEDDGDLSQHRGV